MSFLGLFLFLSLGSSMVTACSPVGTPLLNSSHLDQILSSAFFSTWRLKMLLGPRKPRPTPAGNQMCISLSAQVKSASKPEACSLSPVCSLYLTFLTQTQYPTLRCSLGEWHSTNGEEGAEGRGGAQTGRRTNSTSARSPWGHRFKVMSKTEVLGWEWGGGSDVHKNI